MDLSFAMHDAASFVDRLPGKLLPSDLPAQDRADWQNAIGYLFEGNVMPLALAANKRAGKPGFNAEMSRRNMSAKELYEFQHAFDEFFSKNPPTAVTSSIDRKKYAASGVRLVAVNLDDSADHHLFHRLYVRAELDCALKSVNWKMLRHHMPLDDRSRCRDHLLDIQKRGGNVDFVETDEHGKAGIAIYYPCLTGPGRTSRHAYLHLIGLWEGVRHMGIGGNVLNQIQDKLISQGCDNITLDAPENDRNLCDWYQRQGWQDTGLRFYRGYKAMRKDIGAAAKPFTL